MKAASLLAILVAWFLLHSASAHVVKGRNLMQELKPQSDTTDNRQCGTPDTPPDKRVALVQQLTTYRAAKAGSIQSSRPDAKKTVPVVVTIVEPDPKDQIIDREYDRPTEAMIATQIDVMNSIFSGVRTNGNNHGIDTHFRFKRCMTRLVEDTAWYTAPDQNMVDSDQKGSIDSRSKSANRVGGTGTLNMYIKSLNLGPPGTGNSSGIATFSWYIPGPNQLEKPFAGYTLGNDGIIVDGSCLPNATINGVPVKYRVTEAAAAHEAGHWLSAFHTFQGTELDDNNQCTENNDTEFPGIGDICSDTPVMYSEHNWTCEAPQDSCPNHAGNDPIFNVMNYMLDACLIGLTENQSNLMKDQWDLIRARGAKRPIANPDDFTDVSASTPTTLDIFKIDVSYLVPATPSIIGDLAWTVQSQPKKGQLTVTNDAFVVQSSTTTQDLKLQLAAATCSVTGPLTATERATQFLYRIKFAGGQQASPAPSPVPYGPCPYLITPVCVNGRTGYRSATCSPTNYCLPHFEGGFCRCFFKPQGTACWVTMWGPNSSVRANTTKEYLRAPRGFTEDGFAVKAGGVVDTQTWSGKGTCDMGVCRTVGRPPRW